MNPASRPLICLVSASHLVSNPRLVKEADALHAAGYRVQVIAGRNFPPNDRLDAAILATAPWSCTIIDYHGGPRAMIQRVLRQVARRRCARPGPPALPVAARAHHPAAAQLAAAAAAVPADLFIGHTLVGLSAAAHAAEVRGARLGFDAEDFHSLETEAASADPVEAKVIHALENTLLSRCVHLTAAAPLIGQAYATTYGIPVPATVLNVFPLREAAPEPRAGAASSALRLYWFSQTIGPGRGLESVIAVLGRMRTPVQLSLRGAEAPGFVAQLRAAARAVGFTGEINALPAAPSAEMARLAAEHDIGLAIESTIPGNRDLCLTNKIFTYLLAGIPMAYTPTRAQREFAGELGAAAVPLDFSDPDGSARRLDGFSSDPGRLAAAKAAAWRLGQTRFNWDREQAVFLKSVETALRPS